MNIKAEILSSFTNSVNSVSNGKPRIQFIDLAKGICILMVVLVHLTFIEFPGAKQIRMPLYFLLSGLFFKTYGGGYKNLTIKKLNKIIIPFVFFLTIGVLLTFVCELIKNRFNIIGAFHVTFGADNFHDFVFGNNGAIWFLLSLFWANLIFCGVIQLLKKQYQIFIAVVTIGLLGNIIGNHFGKLLWIVSAMRALPFFYLGFALKQTKILYPNKIDKYNLPIAIILMSMCVVSTLYLGNPHVEFSKNYSHGNILIFYLIATAGVMGLLFICKAINWLPIISYFGRFSIIILGIHLPLFHVLRTFIPDNVFSNIYVKFIVATTYCILLWLMIPIFKHFFPKFCAQEDLIKL